MTSTSKSQIKNVIDLTQHAKPPAAALKNGLNMKNLFNQNYMPGGKNTMMTTAQTTTKSSKKQHSRQPSQQKKGIKSTMSYAPSDKSGATHS